MMLLPVSTCSHWGSNILCWLPRLHQCVRDQNKQNTVIQDVAHEQYQYKTIHFRQCKLNMKPETSTYLLCMREWFCPDTHILVSIWRNPHEKLRLCRYKSKIYLKERREITELTVSSFAFTILKRKFEVIETDNQWKIPENE